MPLCRFNLLLHTINNTIIFFINPSMFRSIINYLKVLYKQISITIKQMGGEQSGSKNTSQPNKTQENRSIVPTSQMIDELRSTFRLKIVEQVTKITKCFLHTFFSNQIKKYHSETISRKFSPFCSIKVPLVSAEGYESYEILTCAFISPLLLIVYPETLCDKNGYFFHSDLRFQGYPPEKVLLEKIVKLQLIEKMPIGLIILDVPLWQLGWCGLTYLKSSEEISGLAVFTIYHEIKIKNKQKQKNSQNSESSGDEQRKKSPQFSQKIKKCYYQNAGNFIGKGLNKKGNLLFLIIDKKSYIIGVQVNSENCVFFSKAIIEQMQSKMKSFLIPERQRQILKAIDLEDLQMKTKW